MNLGTLKKKKKIKFKKKKKKIKPQPAAQLERFGKIQLWDITKVIFKDNIVIIH